MRYWSIYPLLVLGMLGCTTIPEVDADYRNSIERWHENRIEALSGNTGWLSLAGLFFLEEGANTFGSDPANQLVFPVKASPLIGTYFLQKDSLWLEVAPDVKLEAKGVDFSQPIPIDMKSDPMHIKEKSLIWSIIERGDRFLLRLRDTLNPKIQSLGNVERFPVQEKWKVAATFFPYASPKIIPFQNELGMTLDITIPGQLQFNLEGKSHTLEVLDGGPDEYFLIFGDPTNGDSTYPNGRYMYIPREDSLNLCQIDFNKAYNPPCAFTDYATCLYPPSVNQLSVPVFAGELMYTKK